MVLKLLNILLADDDTDDCIFFKSALAELLLPTELTAVNDGEQLMNHLSKPTTVLPHVLFLDLNMPRKNGFECLLEIKKSEKLNQIPVIIFSTSFEQDVVNLLHNNGAHYFIRKPSQYSKIKEIIHESLLLIAQDDITQPSRENFVLTD